MTPPNLRDLLDQHFSDDELRQLCFDLAIEYENLPGNTRLTKAQSLVEHCLRHNRLSELGIRCCELCPIVTWPDVAELAGEWAKIQAAITAQEDLQGILTADQLAATLTPLRQKETELLLQMGVTISAPTAVTNSGTIAQGDSATSVGERGVNVGRAEFIITGDNNSVQTIIRHYGYQQALPPNPAVLREQIGAYLTWLADWSGTLELRGIQRQGEQVVQPLCANNR